MDEVAASHVDADLLVHYGHACLSQLSPSYLPCTLDLTHDVARTSRLPVTYVFGRKRLHVDECINRLGTYIDANAEQFDFEGVPTVLLRHAVAYTHAASEPCHILL